MKRQAFIVCSLLIGTTLSAQEVVSSQGESYSNSSGNINFTIGEVVTNTETDGTYDITQGFHQSNWTLVGIKNFVPNYEVSIYPNPSTNVLNIKTSSYENVSYKLYDAVGKLIMQGDLSSDLTALQVSYIAQGKYTLTLNDQTQILKTFKLIKVQ